MTIIKRRRLELGWTQVDLAKRVNQDPSNTSRLESGATKAGPGLRERVSTALGMEAEELFDGQGWPLDD